MTIIPKDLFGTSVDPFKTNLYDRPFSKSKLEEAMKSVKKIQASNTLLELVKNLESIIKKGKITNIKVMHNDYLPEGEILISYNPKS